MRFQLFDSFGGVRDISAEVTVCELRNLLSEFKTHCAVEESAYEYNHFVNWLKKYHGISVKKYANEKLTRIDM
jgi:hypothetical protein